MDNETFYDTILQFVDSSSKYYVEEDNNPIVMNKFGECKKIGEDIHVQSTHRNVNLAKTLKLRKDDTFVIGWPKSGTTWIEEICWNLNNNLDYNKAEKLMHLVRVPFLDSGNPEAYLEEQSSPRTFKSHLPIQFLPDNIENNAKIVYCLRNPKDVLVSAYHFFQSLKTNKYTGTFEEMFEAFLRTEGNELLYGSWFTHVNIYYNRPNVHLVIYEDLLEKPLETLKSLAKFLEKEYTDEQLQELIAKTSFANLKAKENDDGTRQFLIDIQWFDRNMNFFRKGQIGSWREHFTEEMSKRMDEAVAQKLKEKIEFNYGH